MAEQTIIPPSGDLPVQPVVYAGIVRRFWAMAVDRALVYVLWLLILIPLGVVEAIGGAIAVPFPVWGVPSVGLACLGVDWIYFAWQESSDRSATLGKRWLGLRVTDERGGPLTFRRASLRYFMKYVSAAPMMLGFAMAFFTKRKQALHDLIAETLVIRV